MAAAVQEATDYGSSALFLGLENTFPAQGVCREVGGGGTGRLALESDATSWYNIDSRKALSWLCKEICLSSKF